MDRAPARELVSPPVKQMHYRSNSLYSFCRHASSSYVTSWIVFCCSILWDSHNQIYSLFSATGYNLTLRILRGLLYSTHLPRPNSSSVSSLNCLLPLQRPAWSTANTTWVEVITNISEGKSFSHSRLLMSWMAKVPSPGTWWKHWVLTGWDRQHGVVAHAYNSRIGRMWLEFSGFRLACVTQWEPISKQTQGRIKQTKPKKPCPENCSNSNKRQSKSEKREKAVILRSVAGLIRLLATQLSSTFSEI